MLWHTLEVQWSFLEALKKSMNEKHALFSSLSKVCFVSYLFVKYLMLKYFQSVFISLFIYSIVDLLSMPCCLRKVTTLLVPLVNNNSLLCTNYATPNQNCWSLFFYFFQRIIKNKFKLLKIILTSSAVLKLGQLPKVACSTN